ncbi:hypothetical protein LTR40_012108, partial [Exophiala xenobiotica]
RASYAAQLDGLAMVEYHRVLCLETSVIQEEGVRAHVKLCQERCKWQVAACSSELMQVIHRME